MIMDKLYDIVVFGATGFCGQNVTRELLLIGRKHENVTLAIAGRNKEKLEFIQKDLEVDYGATIGILCGNVQDRESLYCICSASRLLINCVGPYKKLGSPVVEACIAHKCDYMDMTGEKVFMELLIQKYDKLANEKGVFIMPSCGFSSLASNLAISISLEKSMGSFGVMNSYLSFGCENGAKPTYNVTSLKAIVDEMNDASEYSYAKSEGHSTDPKSKARGLHWSKQLNCYALPFPAPEVATIRRHYKNQKFNGHLLRCNMYLTFSCFMDIILTILMFSIIKVMSITGVTRDLLFLHPKFFTLGNFTNNGPTKNQMKNTFFKISVFPNESSNPEPIVTLSGKEMAYHTCSKIVSTAAFCFLKERGRFSSQGGVKECGFLIENTNIKDKLSSMDLQLKS